MGWLGLLLLVLNALLPALVPADPARAAGLPGGVLAPAVPAGGDQIVICTPTGLRLITVDAQGKPVEKKDRTREGYCVFCLPLVHAASGALAPLVLPVPLPGVYLVRALPVQTSADHLPLPAAQAFARSRAPPMVQM
jgi:hypothetical protein